MPTVKLGINVFESALQRLLDHYEEGNRVVISISGGKDSTCVLELAVIAARMTDRLPVEVVTRDEEVIHPGVPEYLERLQERTDEIDLHWFVAHQPIINAFNREQPYWWVYDPLLSPEEWVRPLPPKAEFIDDINIKSMVTLERFPPPEGKRLIDCIGLRAEESSGRYLSVISAGGHMTGVRDRGAYGCRPIYDWRDGDVWKAIGENGWDYASTYDVMHRAGVNRRSLRIGPPSMNVAAIMQLPVVSQAWPQWWDRVCRRLPGLRTAAQFGKRVCEPDRRHGELWQTTFWRECVENAPAWIAERATILGEQMPKRHAQHSTSPFPEVEGCLGCTAVIGSWRNLTNVMYLGDPFSQKAASLPYVDPEVFRPGSGTWSGKPSF